MKEVTTRLPASSTAIVTVPRPHEVFLADPRADSRLNPTRGETLWIAADTTITATVLMDRGLSTLELQVEGDLEITLSPIAGRADYWKVRLFLREYNAQFIDRASCSDFTVKTQETSNSVAIAFQQSLRLRKTSLNTLLSKIGPDALSDVLTDIEAEAIARGAQRMYATSASDNAVFVRLLLAAGFGKKETILDLETGQPERFFYKERLTDRASHPRTDLSWSKHEDDGSDENGEHFGVFVRRRTDGVVQGGLVGTFHGEAAIPYSDIDMVCMGNIRGAGFGTKVMQFAEAHSRKCGARFVELDTNEWQAPKFYKKLGYALIRIAPKLIQGRDGTPYDNYR